MIGVRKLASNYLLYPGLFKVWLIFLHLDKVGRYFLFTQNGENMVSECFPLCHILSIWLSETYMKAILRQWRNNCRMGSIFKQIFINFAEKLILTSLNIDKI